ncbi:hypothetical protein COT48_06140 [Candidatus Woesearchaeota archaeon CG08_land_8_20_14_0_20_47_9]|nr:MAG: hypothetical protein COT48_06140 [Candidatus Woesearchaeota archaeon CG08_land_8_20_14_0_20_47_9]HII30317.1 MBL fold metallo-hydrolase [Candidatus Woesearchaeota archaeon]
MPRDVCGLEIINTPGHTAGSVCIWYKKEGVLFSGDTIFRKGIGRTDLPSSRPGLMKASLARVSKLPFKLLCPGHDYVSPG